MANVDKQGESELMHERELHSRPTYNEAIMANVDKQEESKLMHERELHNRSTYKQAMMANIDSNLKQESDQQIIVDKEYSYPMNLKQIKSQYVPDRSSALTGKASAIPSLPPIPYVEKLNTESDDSIFEQQNARNAGMETLDILK